MRYLIVLLILFALIPLVPQPPATAAGPCDGAQVTNLSDPVTKGVWDEIMRRRQANGYAAYQWSDTLALSAAWMARDRASQSTTVNTTVDSLGRNARQRATDCGYRTDAKVVETSGRVLNNTYPFSIYLIWNGGDAIDMYWAIRSGAPQPDSDVYQVAALGRYRNADGWEYWVMDVGTLPDGGGPVPLTATPVPTPVPPTATPVPTPEPDEYPFEYKCKRMGEDANGVVTWRCNR